MRSSAAFLARFLVGAAALFGLWSFGGVGDAYTRAVVFTANPAVRFVTGFRITRADPTNDGLRLTIARGPDVAVLPLRPREAFSGIVPFFALVMATVGIPAGRRLRALGFGGSALFLFHIGLLVTWPFFTGGPQGEWPDEWVPYVNRLVDVFYGFYGLVGYAALPFVLWFRLGRPEEPPVQR